jgi:hypothetical protein
MEGIIMSMMVFSIPLAAIIGGYYVKLQKMKIEAGLGKGDNEMQRQMGSLMAENEEIKERLKNLEYILTEDKGKISLKDYDKEKIELDDKEKWSD